MVRRRKLVIEQSNRLVDIILPVISIGPKVIKRKQERDGSNINTISVDPLLFSLHSEPRFKAFLQKLAPPQ